MLPSNYMYTVSLSASKKGSMISRESKRKIHHAQILYVDYLKNWFHFSEEKADRRYIKAVVGGERMVK